MPQLRAAAVQVYNTPELQVNCKILSNASARLLEIDRHGPLGNRSFVSCFHSLAFLVM